MRLEFRFSPHRTFSVIVMNWWRWKLKQKYLLYNIEVIKYNQIIIIIRCFGDISSVNYIFNLRGVFRGEAFKLCIKISLGSNKDLTLAWCLWMAGRKISRFWTPVLGKQVRGTTTNKGGVGVWLNCQFRRCHFGSQDKWVILDYGAPKLAAFCSINEPYSKTKRDLCFDAPCTLLTLENNVRFAQTFPIYFQFQYASFSSREMFFLCFKLQITAYGLPSDELQKRFWNGKSCIRLSGNFISSNSQ